MVFLGAITNWPKEHVQAFADAVRQIADDADELAALPASEYGEAAGHHLRERIVRAFDRVGAGHFGG